MARMSDAEGDEPGIRRHDEVDLLPLATGLHRGIGKILSERHVLGVGDETGSRTVVETPLANSLSGMSGMSSLQVGSTILACSMRAI